MEDGGLAITDFEGFYNGDIDQFKAFAEADIESMFKVEEQFNKEGKTLETSPSLPIKGFW